MRTPASVEVRRYRGAVIGAGGIARQAHLPALRDAAAVRARVDIVALVDSAPDVPPVDGIPLLTRREQLDETRIDFIDICTPTASHLELTLWGPARRPARRGRTGGRAARPRDASHLPAARRRGAAGRGERLDRPAAPPGLRGGGHGVAALRVSRATRHDVLHVGRARAREPHPL